MVHWLFRDLRFSFLPDIIMSLPHCYILGDDYLGANGEWRPKKLPQQAQTCVSVQVILICVHILVITVIM